MTKKKLICLLGESGTGKSTGAEYIETKHRIPLLRSYTDRPKRDESDNGHTFLTPEEFDLIKPEDMIAPVNFGGKRYCCKHSDVTQDHTYVIEPRGLLYLQENYGEIYDVKSILIKRDLEKRSKFVSEERLARDKGFMHLDDEVYDYILHNNKTERVFELQLDYLIKRIKGDLNGYEELIDNE